MSSSYEQVLKEWARKRLLADKLTLSEDDLVVTKVDVYEREADGYCETCWSPGYIDIEIYYRHKDAEGYYTLSGYDDERDGQFETLTNLVRQLEAIAEEMEKGY